MGEHREIEINKDQLDSVVEAHLRSIGVIGDDEDIDEILWPCDMEEKTGEDLVTLEFEVSLRFPPRSRRKTHEE
jgi:hypothetical protein